MLNVQLGLVVFLIEKKLKISLEIQIAKVLYRAYSSLDTTLKRGVWELQPTLNCVTLVNRPLSTRTSDTQKESDVANTAY